MKTQKTNNKEQKTEDGRQKAEILPVQSVRRTGLSSETVKELNYGWF